MSVVEYALFWSSVVVAVGAYFEIFYGRQFRAVMRTQRSDEASAEQRHTLLEQFHELLSKLWEGVTR
jgi:hypothetical protein